jgi:hypothetical protein
MRPGSLDFVRTPPNGQPVDGIAMQRARIFRPSTPITAQTGLVPSFLTDNREPGGQAAAASGSETTAARIAKENVIRDDGDVMLTCLTPQVTYRHVGAANRQSSAHGPTLLASRLGQ